MRRSQRVHSIDCSNSAENESDLNPTSLTRSRRPSHQITPSVSENFNLEENHSDSYLINRTSERSAIQMIYFFYTLRYTVFKAQLCPKYTGWTQTGKASLLLVHHYVLANQTEHRANEREAFRSYFYDFLVSPMIPNRIIITQINTKVKKSTSSLKDLRLYQEKVRKHTEEIEALQSLMEELSAKVQEVKVMSNEDLVAQNIMKKIQGDYIEKPDFALKSIGGTIDFDRTSATYSYDKARSYWSWFRLWNYAHSPEVILEPNMTPGNCWAFSGDRGQVVIRLARKIFLTNVTIQHIPKTISLSGSLDTAPKDFVVYGINDKIKEETFLGAFLFQPENSIQMFPLQNSLCKSFNYIKLKILTNWGNPHFTCLYRVRAHGTISRPAHDHYPQG